MKGSFLVITIESAYIQVSLVHHGLKDVFHISHTFQESFVIKGNPKNLEIEQAMAGALSAVLKKIQSVSGRISVIHIVLSSPWIVSKTKSIHINFPKAINIDHSYIEKIVADEEKEFKKLLPFEVEFIEQKVFETKVNGYHTRIKKTVPAMTLSVSSTMSAMSKRVISKIHNTIEHFYHGGKIFFHSASLLAFISMRHIKPEYTNGIFIHVHGECTDVTLFKDGVPLHFASVNMGATSLVRIFAKSFRTSNAVAESKLTLYEKDDLTSAEKKKVEPVITKLLADWYDQVIQTIEHLENHSAIPQTVVLHSSGHIKFFEETLKKHNAIILPEKIDELYLVGIQLVEFQ